MERLRWIYTLEEDYSCSTNFKLPNDYFFYSYKDDLLMTIRVNGVITVYKGYSWDGCTPKLKIWNTILGTPDGYLVDSRPVTYHASLVHDALYQFLNKLPISRKDADNVFLSLMGNFRYKYIYYFVVRLFGWLFVV